MSSTASFVNSYELTGLAAAADTVVLRTDFRQLMIRFHHDYYEFYDKEFAHEFLRFFRKIGTSGSFARASI